MKEIQLSMDTIDAYILQFPQDVQDTLQELRQLIKAFVPEALEKISYQMPTFYVQGNLVHFAAYKNHIGFYPTPSAVETFKEELAPYKSAKGSVQFPIHQPLPFELIKKIVAFRLDENKKKALRKLKKERIKEQ